MFIFCSQHNQCPQLIPSPVSAVTGSSLGAVGWLVLGGKLGKPGTVPFLKQHRSVVCRGWLLGMVCLDGECAAQPSRVTQNPLFSDFTSGAASGRARLGTGECLDSVFQPYGWGGEGGNNVIKVAFVPCSTDYSNVAMATNLPQIAADNS